MGLHEMGDSVHSIATEKTSGSSYRRSSQNNNCLLESNDCTHETNSTVHTMVENINSSFDVDTLSHGSREAQSVQHNKFDSSCNEEELVDSCPGYDQRSSDGGNEEELVDGCPGYDQRNSD